MLGNSGEGSSNGVDLKFLTYAGAGEGGKQNQTSANKWKGRGSKFESLCENVLFKCSLKKGALHLSNLTRQLKTVKMIF